jgi:hypothetical protein
LGASLFGTLLSTVANMEMPRPEVCRCPFAFMLKALSLDWRGCRRQQHIRETAEILGIILACADS